MTYDDGSYIPQAVKDRTGEEFAVERQRTDALQLAKLREWGVVRVETDNDKRHIRCW